MKVFSLVSVFFCVSVDTTVTAITKPRGTRRGQVERLLSSSKKSGKSGKGGGEYYFLAFPCGVPDFGPGGPGGDLSDGLSLEQSCLTSTGGSGFDSNISSEIDYDQNIGARCCGSVPAATQQWKFNEVNQFFTTVQNKDSGLCLRAPDDCTPPITEDEDEFIGVSFPGLGVCDEENDAYLWSVADLTLTSKACAAEGALSSDLGLIGCTDGIAWMTPFYFNEGGLFGGFIASESVESLTSTNCTASFCSLGDAEGATICPVDVV